MKKFVHYLLIAGLFMGAMNGCGQRSNTDQSDTAQSNMDQSNTDQSDPDDAPCLNEIRFGKWTEKDWLENDYFATLRTCLNDVRQGNTEQMGSAIPESLQPYLSLIGTPFIVVDAEPFIMGGLFVKFVFPAEPDKMFSTWVYGFVDPDTQEVFGYEVRGEVYMEESEMTEEDKITIRKNIDQHIHDNPGTKWLW